MKNIGEKVLGWFIVQEDEHGENTTAAVKPVVQTAADPKPDTVRSAASESSESSAKLESGSRPLQARGSFADVYRSAGLPVEDSERLAKVLDLIASLPHEATLDVKRSIVAAALQAFAVPVDRVVHTATASMSALDAHTESAQAQTDSLLAQARAQIAKLTEEIESLRRAMDAQAKKQDDLRRSTALEKQRVRAVIDFFSHR